MLMLGDINPSALPQGYEIVLCRPGKEQIAYLSEATQVKYTANLVHPHEISFQIPAYVNNDGHTERNENFDALLEDYLILVNNEKYFIVIDPVCKGSDTKEHKEVKCYSLEYELTKKIVTSYKADSRLLYDLAGRLDEDGIPMGILNYIESLVPWKVDILSIPPSLLGKYRCFEFADKSVLEIMNDIQTAFKCIFTYDTLTQTIYIKDFEDIGQNRGLFICKENYLKSIVKTVKSNEIVTKIKCFGKDNISIQGANPTGSNFLLNYSYYMNTLYMSQNMIDALNNYFTYVESKTGSKTNPQVGTFYYYLNRLAVLQSEIEALTNTPVTGLKALETVLLGIQDDKIDALKFGLKNGHDYAYFVGQESITQGQINTVQSQINTKQNEIDTLEYQKQQLLNTFNMSSYLSAEELELLNRLTKEKVWKDEHYDTAEDLMIEGQKTLLKLAQPPIEFSIDVIDFLKLVEYQHDWDKLVLGDIINIVYESFNINSEVRLVGYTHDDQGNGLQLTFSNKNSIDDPYVYLSDLLSESINTSATVNYNKTSWNKSDENSRVIDDIINNGLDAAVTSIKGGRNQNIEFNERGFFLKDSTDANAQIGMLNNIIAFTQDNWQTADLAITPEGIYAKALYSTITVSEKLNIINSAGTFSVDEAGVTLDGMAMTITNGGIPDNQIASSGRWDTEIQAAQEAAGDSMELWENLASDSKLTAVEKQIARNEFDAIFNEYPNLNAQANRYEITTELTNYQVAYNDLNTYVTPLLVDLTTTSDIIGSEFRSKFQNYYNNKVLLIKAVTDKAKVLVEESLTKLSEMASDNMLTPLEKQNTLKEFNIIVVEQPNLVAQANKYEITTELTNYQTAYNALNTHITPLISDLTTTSSIVGSTFRSKFKDYYDKKVLLIKAITDKAKDLVFNAQSSANASLAKLNDIASDDRLTPVEKLSVKLEYASITSEKTDFISQAESYGVSIINYNAAYSYLSTYITPLLSNMSATSDIVRDTFNNKFKAYYAEKVNLINAITNALKNSSVQFETLYNNLKFSTTNGIVVTKSDNTVKATLNATEGFKFETSTDNGSTWTKNLYYNATSKRLVVNGIIQCNDLQDLNGVSMLSGTQIKGSYIEGKGISVKNNLGQTTFQVDTNGNVTLGGSITWNSKPSYTASEVGAVNNSQTAVFNTLTNNGALQGLFMQNGNLYMNASYITAGTISANRITGGTLSGITLNINTNATVGRRLFIGNPDQIVEKEIVFGNNPKTRIGTDPFGDNFLIDVSGWLALLSSGDITLQPGGKAKYKNSEIATLADISSSIPIVVSDVPPTDKSVIWVDTSSI